jgi:prepilin-type N-terminal cleavage/methylation domain-containing protein
MENHEMSNVTCVKATNRSGFTLIELLVVIAIIAILAAILFPVFAQAREKARTIACLSNLKQIGLAVTQYQQDYDEAMPCGTAFNGTGWAAQIYNYVNSVAVFHCPDDPTTGKGSSYGLNSNFYSGGTGVTLSKFNSPSKTVMLFEVEGNAGADVSNPLVNGGYGSPNGYGLGQMVGYDPNGDGVIGSGGCGSGTLQYASGALGGNPSDCSFLNDNATHNATGVHTQGSNFLMSDTHAKWLRGSQVSPGYGYKSETTNSDPPPSYGAAGTEAYFSDNKTEPAATWNLN